MDECLLAAGDDATIGALLLSAAPGLHQIWVSAHRARPVYGLVPGDKVTRGVALAAVEGAAFLGSALDDLALATSRAGNPDALQQWPCVPALRKSAAGKDFAKLPKLDPA